MKLEDVDRLQKLAAEYRNLANMEKQLSCDWKSQRIYVGIEWVASGKEDRFINDFSQAQLREQFAAGVRVVRERVQTQLALLGVEDFPEIK